LALAAIAGASQRLSAEDIARAIEQGARGTHLDWTCVANRAELERGVTEAPFRVLAEGPAGRIMHAARDAHAQRQAFSAADVTEALQAPVLTIVANALAPLDIVDDSRHTGALVLGVTLRTRPSKGQVAVSLEPVSHRRLQPQVPYVGGVIWSGNRFLDNWAGAGTVAEFDLSAFRALPPGDLDVILITGLGKAGEQSCKMGAKNRQTLR
jgi:hypothetical protein